MSGLAFMPRSAKDFIPPRGRDRPHRLSLQLIFKIVAVHFISS
jgi:hypothetical protein